MTVKINHNVASLRSMRYMGETDKKISDSLERLSSGFRINKGADSPAGLLISEKMRAQIASVNQAISNTEVAQAMVQTSEGTLNEVNNLLVRMRQLTLHATNEGANDAKTLEADQLELRNALESIQRIAESAKFGDRKLLDGSTGISGTAQGQGLTFVKSGDRSKSSPIGGYNVVVDRVATRARMEGDEEITKSNLPTLSVTLVEGGKTLTVNADKNDTVERFVSRLKVAVEQEGMALEVQNREGKLSITHKEYGSKYGFAASSSVAGVLSKESDVLEKATAGVDIAGTIGGEAAIGDGQFLTGGVGNDATEGLTVKYTGPLVEQTDAEGQKVMVFRPQAGMAGHVHMVNNALTFQTGGDLGDKTMVVLPNVSPQSLGRNVTTETGMRNMWELDVTSSKKAQDSLRIIDSSINEISLARGKLGAFQRNNLEVNMASLRVTAENLISAESAIRDTDVAQEMTDLTKNRILLESSAAMLAQANQIPRRVISLLE